MSMGRRMALLEFARENNTVVIEDDYDCEFRFDGRPLDALQSFAASGYEGLWSLAPLYSTCP